MRTIDGVTFQQRSVAFGSLRDAPGWPSIVWLAFVLLLVAGISGSAKAETDDPIPPHLQPWKAWVLEDVGDAACPEVGDARACTWPGKLDLRLRATGGSFALHVFVEQRQFVTLPGDNGAWPTQTTLSSLGEAERSVPVLEREGRPHVELLPGAYVVAGAFVWDRLPETLSIGETTAFVDLEIDGTPVALAKRDRGQLWLNEGRSETEGDGARDHAELQVYRLITDGVPVLVETRMVWDVGGRAREIELESPLIPGTIPLSVEGDLPLALGPTGRLRIQLAPGHHEITLWARTQGAPESLQNVPRPPPWPAQEVWVWKPADDIRVAEVGGVTGLDASRTQLPPQWSSWSAYQVDAAGTMTFTTTRRGEAQLPPNRLALRRELWLDESSPAFTVRDEISGEMHQSWRLDLLHGELGQVVLEGQPQLITLRPDPSSATETRGVELRASQVQMTAISRVPHTDELAAVGWSEDMDSLSAELHLPPGWDVFASQGVDSMYGTWVSRWNLFSVFYVLVVTLAVARLVSVGAGAVALLALILGQGEPKAPEYLWALMVMLLALARGTRLPGWSRTFRMAFRVTGMILLITLVSFAVVQMRHALYPHLDAFSGSYDFSVASMEMAPVYEPAPVAPEEAMSKEDIQQSDGSEHDLITQSASIPMLKKGGKQSYRQSDPFELRPDVVVQTGPGIPQGTGRSWSLSWSGPVARDHTIDLWLISPAMMRILTVFRLLAMFLLGWLLWKALGPPPPATATPSPGDTLRAPVLALLMLLIPWHSAHAEEPSTAMLETLRQRLTRPPTCAPLCITVSRARLEVRDTFHWSAEVHAGAVAGYILPGPIHGLRDVEVWVDGVASVAVRHDGDGTATVRLTPGVHTVEMRGGFTSERWILELGSPPHAIEVDAPGWATSGINDRGRAEGNTITLVREVAPLSGDAKPSGDNTRVAVPSSYRVQRTLVLGVHGRVFTEVERISDSGSPETLELDLIEGEQVTTPGIAVQGSRTSLGFARGATEVTFESTLPRLESSTEEFSLTLTAPGLEAPYVETWNVDCGVLWHCTMEGITANAHLEEGRYVAQFTPLPGETLTLDAYQPSPADGQSLTIEGATLTLSPGIRMGRGELSISLRTSRAQVHTVTIPASARLEKVLVDNVSQSARTEDGRVQISLGAGAHEVRIQWQQDEGLTTRFDTPAVDLGAPAVNLRTIVELPEDRWLLLAGGPRQGPAILLWGYVALILIAAVLLSRMPGTPMGVGSWLLLGLGLTHVPAVVAVFVASWFFAVALRPRWVTSAVMIKHEFLRDLAQLTLVVGTFLFLVALTVAVYEGLVSSPDMDVAGAGSSGSRLVWYTDRGPGALPNAWVVSVSIWVWRGVMLAWALWLASALLRWLRWAWKTSSEYGFWSPGTWRRSKQRATHNHEV